MDAVLRALVSSLLAPRRSRASLQAEILALRHQLAVYERGQPRTRLRPADRIHAELAKVGIEVAKSTVGRDMVRRAKPPSPTWRTFLENHVRDLVSIDFFLVPTVNFRLLFVFLVLATDRRRILHFSITKHPTATRTARQIVEAFPWGDAPSYLLRDRDRIYGADFRRRVRGLGMKEVLTAARSPWQNPYVERVIGSIRRECLGYVVVLSERHLKRLLSDYFDYYHRWRTHRSLEMDAPDGREIHERDVGEVIELPEVGGLHHHYERQAG